jgi:hypothetical protein
MKRFFLLLFTLSFLVAMTGGCALIEHEDKDKRDKKEKKEKKDKDGQKEKKKKKAPKDKDATGSRAEKSGDRTDGPGTGKVPTDKASKKGWHSLFDGKSFDGWKVTTENKECFTIQDGAIVAKGNRAHLFYDGPIQGHKFTNFELEVDVMTRKGSNGGIYFSTEYQETGWPSKGYEVQVNNTHSDWRKTGSLYAIQDVKEQVAKDDVWFTERIVVQGKHVLISVDGKTVVDYTEPANAERTPDMKGRLIAPGTIALQGHDPNSTVYYKNIQIKPLP